MMITCKPRERLLVCSMNWMWFGLCLILSHVQYIAIIISLVQAILYCFSIGVDQCTNKLLFREARLCSFDKLDSMTVVLFIVESFGRSLAVKEFDALVCLVVDICPAFR